jgi:hypothetical protein
VSARRAVAGARLVAHVLGELIPLDAFPGPGAHVPAQALGAAVKGSEDASDPFVHPLLAAVASADEVARPKPAPDVYRLAVKRLGTGPNGVVAIEDSATGMASARAAGLICVDVRTPVTWGHDLGRASLLVTSLAELDPGTLARLVPGGTD